MEPLLGGGGGGGGLTCACATISRGRDGENNINRSQQKNTKKQLHLSFLCAVEKWMCSST